MARLIIDGMNVIGSHPNGWWRDRDGAVRGLVEDLDALGSDAGGDISVVFDGPLPADLPEGTHGGVRVIAAGRRGPNAADDRLVALVSAESDPGSVVVVTSDRALGERVRRLGASVTGPQSLLRMIRAHADARG